MGARLNKESVTNEHLHGESQQRAEYELSDKGWPVCSVRRGRRPQWFSWVSFLTPVGLNRQRNTALTGPGSEPSTQDGLVMVVDGTHILELFFFTIFSRYIHLRLLLRYTVYLFFESSLCITRLSCQRLNMSFLPSSLLFVILFTWRVFHLRGHRRSPFSYLTIFPSKLWEIYFSPAAPSPFWKVLRGWHVPDPLSSRHGLFPFPSSYLTQREGCLPAPYCDTLARGENFQRVTGLARERGSERYR